MRRNFLSLMSFLIIGSVFHSPFLRADEVTPNDASQRALGLGVNQLGYRIFQQIHKTESEKNLFISPLSLHEALSMAYVGSEGATRKELAALLGVSHSDSNTRLADTWESLRKALENADPKIKLAIANSMWANAANDVTFKKSFVELNTRAHGAVLRSMDFQSKGFLSALNGWVKEKTQGKIPTILNPPIPKDQLFYLVNAIYFKGAWKNEFDKKITKDADFRRQSGSMKVKMMSQNGRFRYTDSRLEGQLVEIPFGKKGEMVMTVYLPTSLVSKRFYTDMGARLTAMREKLRNREGSVSIPRFSIEYGNNKVIDVLKALGVKIVFSNDSDLSGIAEGEEAKINTIIHKAIIDVNEEGAEAAAATVIGGSRTTSAPLEPPFSFIADRPFYFDIRDLKSDLTLFAGVVNEPKEPKK